MRRWKLALIATVGALVGGAVASGRQVPSTFQRFAAPGTPWDWGGTTGPPDGPYVGQ
jgi:hypothetical protein